MKYYVNGYTPPKDVNGRDDVLRYQRMFGIKTDGIWGKNTQAAYEGYLGSANQTKSNNMQLTGNDTLNLTGDRVDWNGISKELGQYLSGILRPAVDSAIENRRQANDTARAEIDADTSSRGMGSSTYSSSLKDRGNQAMQSDIANMESQYQSTLASELYNAMFKLADMQAEQSRFESEEKLTREKMKQDQAQFEEQLAYSRKREAEARSGEKKASNDKKSSDDKKGESTFDYNDYCDYVTQLGDDAEQFFYGNELFWQNARAIALNDLGEERFYQLLELFTDSSGGSGGGMKKSDSYVIAETK